MTTDSQLVSVWQNREEIKTWLSKPSSPFVLFAIIAAGHISGFFTYGATFWVDIRAYVYFSQIFNSIESAKAVFENPQYSFYSHIGLGEPFVWYIVSKLPVDWAWPAMAAGKHALGIVGLSYLFITINRFFPSRIHVFTAAIISFLPFYQSMHNMLMTEAISTNCILMVLAASIQIYFNSEIVNNKSNPSTVSIWYRWKESIQWLIIIVCSCIAVQFRSILIIFPFSFIIILLFTKFSSKRTLISGITMLMIFVSVLSFAFYRYRVTGDFALSTAWGWSIITGQNITRSTNPKVMDYVKTVPWPDSAVYVAKIENGKFDRHDLEKVLVYWREIGLKEDEAKHICDTILDLHYRDGGISLHLRRFLVGLTTLGFTVYSPLLPDILIPQRGQDGISFFKDKVWQYRYYSWINPKPDIFYTFSNKKYFDDTPVHEHYLASIKPYLKLSRKIMSNPMFMGSGPVDLWFFCGCFSIFYLYKKRNNIMVFLLLPMILSCVAIYFNPVSAGVRYSYSFMPMYICFFSIALSIYLRSSISMKTSP